MGKSETPKKIAVVGAGPAGLAYATTAAERGHQVTLFEKSNEFMVNLTWPGKENTLLEVMIKKYGVKLQLNTLFEPLKFH